METEIQSSNARIVSLDVIRGFAILGILFMNIQSFSMIGQAYLNPTAYGNFAGLNQWVWIVSHFIADQKFMSIFSMMFGASIIMITQRIERKNQSSLGLHYRRNFWLLVFGLLHAYLIWYGDILAPYAICAFLIYPLRKLRPRTLIILGILLLAINSIRDISTGLSVLTWPESEVEKLSRSWTPSSQQIEREVNAYLGSFSDQLKQRRRTAMMMHTSYFMNHYLWRVSGLMLIGMALFKSGFLSGKLHINLYKKTMIYSGVLGVLLVIAGLIFNFTVNWALEYSMFLGSQFNYWGSIGMGLAYMAGMTIICHYGYFPSLNSRLAAIGRTALSNYILQSLICASIFYGFGYFGKVDRVYQLLIIVGIWLLQLYLSPFWMKHFRYGPLECLWRSLTYAKIYKARSINPPKA